MEREELIIDTRERSKGTSFLVFRSGENWDEETEPTDSSSVLVVSSVRGGSRE